MILSVLVCFASFAAVVALLRAERMSLGLPIAYLFALLLIHVPGAIAHITGGAVLKETPFTELGIYYTAAGAVFFAAGVWIARMTTPLPPPPVPLYGLQRARFWVFCLVAGWFFTYGLSPLKAIPSLGAAVEKASAVWMLGVMLGLRDSVAAGSYRNVAKWLVALAVYPVLMLLLGGFLSYGSTAIIIVGCILAVSVRGHWRVAAGIVVAAVLAFNVFLAYFENRDQIRDAVWGGASMQERIDRTLGMAESFGWFDPANETQLTSIDQRLNQNYFVGLAATRIEDGEVDYLWGRSIGEGLTALIPRALWPSKPVGAGSPKIVSEMTGLELSESTSFGVGNVMEFQINFGMAGVAGGFLILGWLIGLLDRKAAIAERDGDLGQVFIYFLPAIALIQPNGSMVELFSGSIAALAGAYGWRWAWGQWAGRDRRRAQGQRAFQRNR